MSVRPLLLWPLALGLYCVQDVSAYSLGGACNSSDCIIKCCPKNQIYLREYDDDDDVRCVDNSELIKKFNVKNPNVYSNIDVYNKDIKRKILKTVKKISSFKFEYVVNFTNDASELGTLGSMESYTTYLLEDGKLILRRLNYLNQWIPFEPGQFCLEHEVIWDDGKLESTTPDVVVWVLPDPSEKPPSNARALLSAYGLLVSCVFLVLVLAVYALLPELRNLAGLILMAYMSTYFAFFLTRVIHVFGNEAEVLNTKACGVITIMFYYLMLSTFCWMNVMSFDIWWTFRRIRKASHRRRSVMSKFWRYCAYAWGVPLLPTLFIVIVDQLNITHLPNFVKPHIFDSCYFEPELHLLYVSIPILILICVNVVLFLLTAFNIWEVNHGVTLLSKDSANTKKNESHRFWLYMRLSLVMGVSWILEVISNLVEPESPVWGISDLYNALVGLFIFLLFVCKKNTFLRLCTRLSIDNKLVRWVRAQEGDSRADQNAKSSASQQTYASEVEPWNPSKEVRNRPDDI